ncbi:hypothetical protein DPMN_171083 [Dreissena polymorpha]|uniref:Uncharacterized protein n=1 Tax=Dreissena polymorpha TaxID=45954 RepID=A0A9D4IC43_DREPO|nr:hypothetical protein DPMN_171083 [Dreissena polymorpha]
MEPNAQPTPNIITNPHVYTIHMIAPHRYRISHSLTICTRHYRVLHSDVGGFQYTGQSINIEIVRVRGGTLDQCAPLPTPSFNDSKRTSLAGEPYSNMKDQPSHGQCYRHIYLSVLTDLIAKIIWDRKPLWMREPLDTSRHCDPRQRCHLFSETKPLKTRRNCKLKFPSSADLLPINMDSSLNLLSFNTGDLY